MYLRLEVRVGVRVGGKVRVGLRELLENIRLPCSLKNGGERCVTQLITYGHLVSGPTTHI